MSEKSNEKLDLLRIKIEPKWLYIQTMLIRYGLQQGTEGKLRDTGHYSYHCVLRK